MTEQNTNPITNESGSSEGQTKEVTGEPTGEVTQSWYDNVPEEYRENQSITSLKDKDFNEFVKDYVNKDGLVGRKGIILPKDGDEADTSRFYNELGRPETADGYETPELEVPEEVKQFVDTTRVEGFKQLAHKYGLSEDQYKGIVTEFMQQEIGGVKQSYDDQVAKANETKTTLRNEWGEKTDERIAGAQKIIDAFADESSYEFFNANNKDAGLIRFLDGISQKLSSDSINSTGQTQVTMSKADAQARMNEILQSDDYWVEIPTPGAKSVRQEYQELAKIVR